MLATRPVCAYPIYTHRHKEAHTHTQIHTVHGYHYNHSCRRIRCSLQTPPHLITGINIHHSHIAPAPPWHQGPHAYSYTTLKLCKARDHPPINSVSSFHTYTSLTGQLCRLLLTNARHSPSAIACITPATCAGSPHR